MLTQRNKYNKTYFDATVVLVGLSKYSVVEDLSVQSRRERTLKRKNISHKSPVVCSGMMSSK